MEIASWDLGGQKKYREMYLQNKEKYFTEIYAGFFVIDIQCPERFDEALKYFKEILENVIELNPGYSKFYVLLHKFDPDLKGDKKILNDIEILKKNIISLKPDLDFSFYNTSIHDDTSLIKPFSDGVISGSQKARLIQTLLKEYTTKSFNSAAILLDRHCFIIASRSTEEYYEHICQEIAPRLAQAIETLEECEINAMDIVTNINFPINDSVEEREGIIFLRKIDINLERLYLIALCLNKKIKVKSYEYLPLLANNLKNLLETFK